MKAPFATAITCASFFVGLLALNAPASAQTCIQELVGAERLATGIATATPETALYANDCDGGWHQLTGIVDGKATFKATKSPKRNDIDDGSNPLVDTDVTGGRGAVQAAWLTRPSDEYRHGILGDAVEAKGVMVRIRSGKTAEFVLPKGVVFEDRRARLVDLNGDGRDELLLVRAEYGKGGGLVSYAYADRQITELAIAPPIGRSNRWLNPAGAADFDNDGQIEVALVETPHIGGTLRFFSLRGDQLVEEYAMRGFSNHLIGARELDLATVIDWNRDGVLDIVVPDNPRSTLRIISLASGEPTEIDTISNSGEIGTGIYSYVERAGGMALIYALRTGEVRIVPRP